MKKYTAPIILIAVAVAGLVIMSPANGTAASGSGVTTAEFLKINPDPQIVAMGDGSTAVTSDLPSIAMSNPAGLAGVHRAKLTLNYISYVEGLKHHFSSFAMPFAYGNVGFSINYLTYGKIQGYYADWTSYNIPSSHDVSFLMSYALPIRKSIPVSKDLGSIGINVKLIQSKLADYSAEAIAADLGLIYNIDFVKGLSVGAAYKNLGSGLKFVKEKNALPATLNVGLCYNRKSLRGLSIVADYDKPNKGPATLSAGLSVTPVYFLSLRGGLSQTQDSFTSGIKTGIGLKFGDFNIDYSFSPVEHFSSVHHMSVSISIGSIFKPEKASDYYLDSHFKKAVEHYRTHDYIVAKQKFEEIMAAYPNHTPSKEYLVKIKKAMNNLRKKEETKADKWLKKADRALIKKDYITARRHYYYVLNIDPEHKAANDGLDRIDVVLKDIELEKQRQQNSEKIKKMWNIAMADYRKGDLVTAKDKFKAILLVDPGHKGTKKYLVQIDNQIKKAASTEINKIYDQATKLYKQGKYDMAAKYFEAVSLAEPQRLDAKDFMERCKTKLDEKAKKARAKKVARQQKEITTRMSSTYKKALKQYEKRRYDKALENFKAAKKIARKYKFNKYLGKIDRYITLSKSALAEKYYKKGFKSFQKNNFDEATKCYRTALKYDPDHASAGVELKRITKNLSQQYYEKGMSYFSQGDMVNAKKAFEKALAYNPKMKESKRALERIK